MIQRIQSVWLLLAAIAMSGLFYLPYYYATVNALPQSITIVKDYVGIILTSISIVLSLVTIFRYKNRKAQKGLIWLNVLIILGLLGWLLAVQVQPYANDPGAAYRIGAFLPVVVLVFLFLALGGIRKDEKLLKSLERLR